MVFMSFFRFEITFCRFLSIFLQVGTIFVSLQSRKRRIDTRSEPDKIVSSIVDDMDNALRLATKTMGMFWF